MHLFMSARLEWRMYVPGNRLCCFSNGAIWEMGDEDPIRVGNEAVLAGG